MAQIGYTPIQLYYSTTPTVVPSGSRLIAGELALNIVDGKLYYKDNAGVVQKLADKGAATGNLPGGGVGTLVYQSATGVTAYLANGTTGQVLNANTGAAPSWGNSVNAATNLAGGVQWQLPYQTAPNTTAFVPAPASAGLVLGWQGPSSGFGWVSAPAATSAANLAGGAAFQVPYQSAPNTTQFSNNFQFNGTYLRVGDTTPLSGATNPTFAATANQNQYVQSYIYNANAGTSASADFVAYGDNSTDVSGWADVGFTSSGYADATYTVTGPNESYFFASAPAGSGTSGNAVYATDGTGTTNAHQWYVGGFTQSKSAYKMQLTATELTLATPLKVTGSTGTSGFLLASAGPSAAPSWINPSTIGTSNAKLYFFGQF